MAWLERVGGIRMLSQLPPVRALATRSTHPTQHLFPDHLAALVGYRCPDVPRTVLNSPLGKYPLALGGAGVRRAIRRDHPQFNSVLDFSSYTPLKSPLRYAKGDASHFHKAAMQYLFDQIDPTSSQPMVTFRHNKDLLADTAATLFNVLQPVGKMGAAATTKSQSSVTLMNALATTGALLSESKHRSRTYLEDDERALVSEFVVGFANAFLSQPSSSPAFGSTDFALLLGSKQIKLHTAACLELAPHATGAVEAIHRSVRESHYSISWKDEVPSYANFEDGLDRGLDLELALHEVVRELHGNETDTLWYGGMDNAILFKLVAPNVIDVSDPVPRSGTTVQLSRKFPGVGRTFTMTLPAGLIAAACDTPPSPSLFVPTLALDWFDIGQTLSSTTTTTADAGSLGLLANPAPYTPSPPLPLLPSGPTLSITLECFAGVRLAFELDANRPMELKPAVLPSSLSKSTPNLTTTLNRPLHSGRTYDGYAASWTGDSNDNGAATGDVVVKVAQPAFDTAAHDTALRVYAEAGLLKSVLSGLGVAPRFRGLWVGNGLGQDPPTASGFSTYLVMLLDDAGPSLLDLGYKWSTLPVDTRTRIRQLYNTIHKSFVVHGDVGLKHICRSATTGDLTLIDFENAQCVDPVTGSTEIADEAASVEELLSI